MVNTAKLCQSVGIPPESFQVRFTEHYSPYLVSYLEVGRQVTPDTIQDENMLLYEAEMLYENTIEELKNELRSIKKFRSSFYGPNSEGNNTDKKTPDPS